MGYVRSPIRLKLVPHCPIMSKCVVSITHEPLIVQRHADGNSTAQVGDLALIEHSSDVVYHHYVGLEPSKLLYQPRSKVTPIPE